MELKFRFWSEPRKRWEYFTLYNIAQYRKEFEEHLADGDKPYLCTGRKDKNGKEIYAGDILHFEAKEWGKNGVDFTVFWDCATASFIGVGVPADWSKWCHIIGNIYETPTQAVR